MARFRDCLGREWEFRITTTDIKRLKEVGLDVADLMTSMERLPEILFGDAERLATGLYRLVRPAITPDEFGDGMDGPTLEAGGVALVEACIDFFPRSRVAQAAKGRIREVLDEMDSRLVQLLTASSEGAGNSPASAA